MTKNVDIPIWETLEEYIAENRAASIIKLFDQLNPAETARLIAQLSEEFREKLLTILDPDKAASLLHSIPDEQAADIIEKISVDEAAAIIDQMPPDEQADILSDIKTEDANAILDAMPEDDASVTRQIMEYTPDTAGGIMIKDYLAYSDQATCGEIINDLQTHQEQYTDHMFEEQNVLASKQSSNTRYAFLRMPCFIRFA